MSEEFYVEGSKDSLVCVDVETLASGKVAVYAPTERLSGTAFRRVLRSEFPGMRFVVAIVPPGLHKAVELKGGGYE